MNKSERQIVEHLAMQETAIADLYAAFAVALPEMARFWKGLVAEEKAHAAVIWNLAELCEEADVQINAQTFNVETIRTNIAYIHRQAEAAHAGTVTTLRALSLALDTEKGLIDKQFFRVFKSDNTEIIRELKAIESHTLEHLHSVESRLQDECTGVYRNNLMEAQYTVVSRLAECERMLAQLYSVYSKNLPAMDKFWTSLSNAEWKHASWLQTLGEGMRKGCLTLSVEGVSLKSVELFQKITTEAIAKARDGEVSAQGSVYTALAIETSMLDADFYTTVKSDCKDVYDLTDKLSSETQQHIATLQQALQDLRTSQAG